MEILWIILQMGILNTPYRLSQWFLWVISLRKTHGFLSGCVLRHGLRGKDGFESWFGIQSWLSGFFWGVLGGAVDAVDVISIYSMQKLEVTVPNY